jgi:hypothetical protein
MKKRWSLRRLLTVLGIALIFSSARPDLTYAQTPAEAAATTKPLRSSHRAS